MTRITPRRFTTLQCSQIGFTLVRTFKTASKKGSEQTLNLPGRWSSRNGHPSEKRGDAATPPPDSNNPPAGPYFPLMTSPSEAALVAAFKAGDRSAGEAFFGRYLHDVRGFLGVRCRDGELADELTQEVAARVTAGARALDPDRNVRSYLIRVAHNVWRDWLRHELVRRRVHPALAADGHTAPPAADAELLARELQAALRRAIDALPASQREVVELRHRGDLTFQQIADKLGRPLGTVLTQMRSALQRMRETLETHR